MYDPYEEQRRQLPRGIRNNNPGNIEFGKFARNHGAIGTDGRFARFKSPEQGIGAMRSLLGNYEQKGLNTVNQMIDRWAPSGENNTSAYAHAVAKNMGIAPDAEFSFSRNPDLQNRMIAGMIQHENGMNPYTELLTPKPNMQGGPMAGGQGPMAMPQRAPAPPQPGPSMPPQMPQRPPMMAQAPSPPPQGGPPSGPFGPPPGMGNSGPPQMRPPMQMAQGGPPMPPGGPPMNTPGPMPQGMPPRPAMPAPPPPMATPAPTPMAQAAPATPAKSAGPLAGMGGKIGGLLSALGSLGGGDNGAAQAAAMANEEAQRKRAEFAMQSLPYGPGGHFL